MSPKKVMMQGMRQQGHRMRCPLHDENEKWLKDKQQMRRTNGVHVMLIADIDS
jgi:hypothetical protein